MNNKVVIVCVILMVVILAVYFLVKMSRDKKEKEEKRDIQPNEGKDTVSFPSDETDIKKTVPADDRTENKIENENLNTHSEVAFEASSEISIDEKQSKTTDEYADWQKQNLEKTENKE